MSAPRGSTLLEVAVAMAVLAVGIAAVGTLVVASTGQNRRTLGTAQAELVAARELERIVALGCTNPASDTQFCDNLRALDNSAYDVFWSAGGAQTLAAVPNATQRTYHVQVDVDGTGVCGATNCFEGVETGFPRLNRTLVAGQAAARLLNVRVSVSWTDPSRPRQVVALQTRVAP